MDGWKRDEENMAPAGGGGNHHVFNSWQLHEGMNEGGKPIRNRAKRGFGQKRDYVKWWTNWRQARGKATKEKCSSKNEATSGNRPNENVHLFLCSKSLSPTHFL